MPSCLGAVLEFEWAHQQDRYYSHREVAQATGYSRIQVLRTRKKFHYDTSIMIPPSPSTGTLIHVPTGLTKPTINPSLNDGVGYPHLETKEDIPSSTGNGSEPRSQVCPGAVLPSEASKMIPPPETNTNEATMLEALLEGLQDPRWHDVKLVRDSCLPEVYERAQIMGYDPKEAGNLSCYQRTFKCSVTFTVQVFQNSTVVVHIGGSEVGGLDPTGLFNIYGEVACQVYLLTMSLPHVEDFRVVNVHFNKDSKDLRFAARELTLAVAAGIFFRVYNKKLKGGELVARQELGGNAQGVTSLLTLVRAGATVQNWLQEKDQVIALLLREIRQEKDELLRERGELRATRDEFARGMNAVRAVMDMVGRSSSNGAPKEAVSSASKIEGAGVQSFPPGGRGGPQKDGVHNNAMGVQVPSLPAQDLSASEQIAAEQGYDIKTLHSSIKKTFGEGYSSRQQYVEHTQASLEAESCPVPDHCPHRIRSTGRVYLNCSITGDHVADREGNDPYIPCKNYVLPDGSWKCDRWQECEHNKEAKK